MKEWIAKQTAIMDRYDPEKKLGLYVDEWGIWVDPNPGSNPGFLQQQNTMRDAVIAALNLNIFMRNADRVRGTNIAQMVNVLQAMILTDGPKMLLTPTYHVYRMYVPFHDATVVPRKLRRGHLRHGDINLPRVDAVAARDTSGKLWLALVNVDPNRPTKVSAALAGVKATSAKGEILTAAAVDAHNSFERAERCCAKAFQRPRVGRTAAVRSSAEVDRRGRGSVETLGSRGVSRMKYVALTITAAALALAGLRPKERRLREGPCNSSSAFRRSGRNRAGVPPRRMPLERRPISARST